MRAAPHHRHRGDRRRPGRDDGRRVPEAPRPTGSSRCPRSPPRRWRPATRPTHTRSRWPPRRRAGRATPPSPRSLEAMRGHQFLDFNPARAGPGGRGLRQPGHGHPGGHPGARLGHVPDDVRFPWHRLTGRRGRAPSRRGAPAGPRGSPRGHRLAGLRDPEHAQPGRHDLGRRRAGRGRAAPVRGRSGQARPPGRADLPQLRIGGLRPGRARTCRSPTSRCTGAREWTPRRCGRCTPPPGCGRAGAPATGSGNVPHVQFLGLGFGQDPMAPGVRRQASSTAAAAGTAATSSRAASRCATSPTSRSATPPE